jgi:hypothetical protein
MVPDRFAEQPWTLEQREFLAALEAGGANKVEHALPIDRMPKVSVRDLQELVDSGLVREASVNGYYIYPRQTPTWPGEEIRQVSDERRPLTFTWAKLVKTILFWLVMILIPIILLQLTGKND